MQLEIFELATPGSVVFLVVREQAPETEQVIPPDQEPNADSDTYALPDGETASSSEYGRTAGA